MLKLKFPPPGLDRRMVAEMWLYPDNTRILELSTKCAPARGARHGRRAPRAFLTEQGVNVTGEQQTKTRTALEFYRQGGEKERKPKPPASSPRASAQEDSGRG